MTVYTPPDYWTGKSTQSSCTMSRAAYRWLVRKSEDRVTSMQPTKSFSNPATKPAWVVALLLATACSSDAGNKGGGGSAGAAASLGGSSVGGQSSSGTSSGTGGAIEPSSGGVPAATGGANPQGTAGISGSSGSAGALVGGAGAAGLGAAGAFPATGGASGNSGGLSNSGGTAPSTGGTAGTSGTAGSGGTSVAGAGAGGVGAGGAAGAGGAGGAGASGAAGAGGETKGCDWTNPTGRVVLFDGTSLDGWQNNSTGGKAHWQLVGDGTMQVVPANPSANLETKATFEDLCLHLEYLTPMYPDNVTGQQRGNSGVYLKRAYEMQVLDSYGQPPAIDGCGAVYSVAPPLVVACNQQLVWNTYEIEFRSSKWNSAGTKIENATIVLAHLNGKVVQRDTALNVSATTAGQADGPGPRPLMLQDHGNPVKFRNIWAKVPRY